MKLAELLGIYAAILSTINIVWNMMRDRPSLKVLIIYGVDQSTGALRHGAMISVQNHSNHPVHITNVSFSINWSTASFKSYLNHFIEFKSFPRNLGWCSCPLSNYDLKDRCPVTIEPRKAHMIFIPEAVIFEVTKQSVSGYFKISVQDAIWRNTLSKKFKYF